MFPPPLYFLKLTFDLFSFLLVDDEDFTLRQLERSVRFNKGIGLKWNPKFQIGI